MSRKVTIQDISRAAGTSPSTVSRVLTGSATVSKEKREAIEQVIKNLNYRPSHIARSLKTSTTYTVGLLLNEINNPFYSAVAQGIEEEANRHGYSLILCNTNEDAERELQSLQILHDKRVDGIILGPTGYNNDYIRDLAQNTPLVQIDRQLDGTSLSAVLVDNEKGAYQATKALIQKGHAYIAVFMWAKHLPTMVARQAGYERALREAGIPVDPRLIVQAASANPLHTAELLLDVMKQKPRPTAAFALNNRFGLGVISGLSRLGAKIPDDMALIVFDDLDFFSMIKPSISAVAQPAYEIGKQAIRLLMKQIEASKVCPAEVVMLPTTLVLRESI